MKLTKYKTNEVTAIKYKSYIITAKRLKNDNYGNPRYEVSIIDTQPQNVYEQMKVVPSKFNYKIYGYTRTYIFSQVYDLEREVITYIEKHFKKSGD